MAKVRMDTARYVRAKEEEQIVELPGAVLRGDNIHYDDASHKGFLKCRFCAVSVHHHAGSKSICGDNLVGPSVHFHTNRGQKHEENCEWPEQVQSKSNSDKYDDSRGYKIHWNTTGFSAQFNKKAGAPYTRGKDKKIITNDDDLVGRRPKSFAFVGGVVDLIKQGNFDRLNDSVVIHRNHKLPWQDFMVRYTNKPNAKHDRFVNLMERLKLNEKPQPCLMEFNLKSGSGAFCAKSLAIFHKRDDKGRRHFIIPRAYLDGDNVKHAMVEAGKYLVLGYARLSTVVKPDSVLHFINMSVTDRQQVQKTDVSALALSPQKP